MSGEEEIEVMALRLQGVDAPELHYKAVPAILLEKMNTKQRTRWRDWEEVEFRQHGSVHATLLVAGALRLFESSEDIDEIRVHAHSRVSSPGDLFDVYGRFVSDVLVGPPENGTSVNDWMLSQGLALPAFYNSMQPEEIRSALAHFSAGSAMELGVMPSYEDRVLPFDNCLRLPPNNRGQVKASDAVGGRFFDPKLYRRQVHYWVNLHAGILNRGTSFRQYLSTIRESWIPLDRFLAGAGEEAALPLSEMINARGHIVHPTWKAVFVERTATLKDREGRVITAFPE